MMLSTIMLVALASCAPLAAAASLERRQFMQAAAGCGAAATTAAATRPATASGILLLPPTKPLMNRYWLMRAGENVKEAEGVIETNAAWKYSFANGLTDRGKEQAQAAAEVIGQGADAPVVRYATARHCKQTADAVGARLGRATRLMPESSLLDARGYGAHEGQRLSSVPELWATYDARSRYARPPEAEDGAYAESVEDVFVRVREFLSVCETTLCDDVVVIAPGSDILSIIEAALRGRKLTSHYDLAYEPGEVRYVGDLGDARGPPPRPDADAAARVRAARRSAPG